MFNLLGSVECTLFHCHGNETHLYYVVMAIRYVFLINTRYEIVVIDIHHSALIQTCWDSYSVTFPANAKLCKCV